MRIPSLIVVSLLALVGAWIALGPRQAHAVHPEVAHGAGGQRDTVDGMSADAGLAPSGTARLDSTSPSAAMSDAPGGRIADLVVLVSLDGFRPDVMGSETRALHRMYLQGASPHVARTITKSATLPSHASMVSGVDVTEHGLDFNSFKPERGHILRPTIFSIVHQAGLPTAMFVGKTKLKHLLIKKQDADFNVKGMRCDRLVDSALPYLREATRGLVFLHFVDPDSAGHRVGWMTDAYFEAIHQADRCLDRVMDTIAESGRADRTLLLVTADHGGHNRSHGTRLDVDRRIPWFAWGAGVRRGRFARPVNTVDTAATVLRALGLGVPSDMQGQPVLEAFTSAFGPQGLGLLGPPLEPAGP